MTEEPSIIVPERPQLIVSGRITPLFVDSLKRWHSEMHGAFSEEGSVSTTWPPEKPLDCFANFERRPQLAIEMALELTTILLEVEANYGMLLGKKAYPHQLGDLKWLIFSLIHDGSSFLIEGAPSSGKTLILGTLMQAATRLQVRGLFSGVVAYGTHRPFILAQQLFSHDDRSSRIHAPPKLSETRAEYKYLVDQCGAKLKSVLSQTQWNLLRTQDEPSMEQLEEKVLTSEGGAAYIEGISQEKRQLIANILLRHGALISDIDEAPMYLPMSSNEKGGQVPTKYSGDLGSGIPPEYIAAGYVLARGEAELEGNDIDRLKEKDLTERKQRYEKTRVLLTTAGNINFKNNRQKIEESLARAGIVIFDDARHGAAIASSAVLEARRKTGFIAPDNMTGDPLIFMASALSTTNGFLSRPQANAYSPRITLLESMEEGADGRQISPNIGVDLFPGPDEPLYPPNSIESLEQVIQAHFADNELATHLHLKQPRECTTLIIVSPACVQATVNRLRQKYMEQKIDAVVVPFRSNKEKNVSRGNTKSPQSEYIMQWMREDDDTHVKIIVASPLDVADALSLQGLENITIGTSSSINENTMHRILGRLLHSRKHVGNDENYRVYFRQLQTTKTNPKTSLFHTLGFAKKPTKTIPLQILRGAKGAARDVRIVGKMKDATEMHIATSAKEIEQRTHGKGTTIQRIRIDNNSQPLTEADLFSPTEIADSINKDAIWEKLETFAERVSSLWNDKSIHAEFREIIWGEVETILPAFMKRRKQAWKETLIQIMIDKGMSPLTALQAVKDKIITAASMGRREDEIPSPHRGSYIAAKDEEIIRPDTSQPSRKGKKKGRIPDFEDLEPDLIDEPEPTILKETEPDLTGELDLDDLSVDIF